MGVMFYNKAPIEHRQAECTGDFRDLLNLPVPISDEEKN